MCACGGSVHRYVCTLYGSGGGGVGGEHAVFNKCTVMLISNPQWPQGGVYAIRHVVLKVDLGIPLCSAH